MLSVAPLRKVVAREIPGTYNGLRLECGHVLPRLMAHETLHRRKRCQQCWQDEVGIPAGIALGVLAAGAILTGSLSTPPSGETQEAAPGRRRRGVATSPRLLAGAGAASPAVGNPVDDHRFPQREWRP